MANLRRRLKPAHRHANKLVRELQGQGTNNPWQKCGRHTLRVAPLQTSATGLAGMERVERVELVELESHPKEKSYVSGS